jgi:cytochrome c5
VARNVSAGQWVAERVAVAEELLWHKTCAQCHAISVTPLPDVKIARWNVVGEQRNRAAESHASADRVETNLPVIAAARTRLQWLPNARFDHDAHTGFSCESCHQNAVTSTESSDILIPGIATCQKCHAQGSDRAESRCFECHTYHDWAQRKEVKAAFTLPALRQHP